MCFCPVGCGLLRDLLLHCLCLCRGYLEVMLDRVFGESALHLNKKLEGAAASGVQRFAGHGGSTLPVLESAAAQPMWLWRVPGLEAAHSARLIQLKLRHSCTHLPCHAVFNLTKRPSLCRRGH